MLNIMEIMNQQNSAEFVQKNKKIEKNKEDFKNIQDSNKKIT